jgi:PAS domain S-box-containing protein
MKFGALRIAIIYITIALIWITLSDRILFLFHNTISNHLYLLIGSGKGYFFVFVTGFLLFKLILIDKSKLDESEKLYHRSDGELKRLADIITRVNNMIIITDKNNLITWVNKATEDCTGFRLEEILGYTPAVFFTGIETDKEVLASVMRRKNSLESFSADIGCYAKNGQRFWVYGEYTPLFNDDDRNTGYIAVYNDITWRKEKEEEITLQNNKLKEVAWLSSHEIRRPLANIMGLVNMMKISSNIEEKVQILGLVNQSAEELDKIVHMINSRIHMEVNV